jgi:hypothetical protein
VIGLFGQTVVEPVITTSTAFALIIETNIDVKKMEITLVNRKERVWELRWENSFILVGLSVKNQLQFKLI